MRLSDAILAGAAQSRQCFGKTFDGDATCALGAALLAIDKRDSQYTDVLTYFPPVARTVEDPISKRPTLMLTAIRVLNDEYRWTRERIARWVASVERAEAKE